MFPWAQISISSTRPPGECRLANKAVSLDFIWFGIHQVVYSTLSAEMGIWEHIEMHFKSEMCDQKSARLS